MTRATHDEILEILGEADDLAIERVWETGASRDQIAEALDDLEDERRFGDEPHLASSPVVLEVRAVLEEVLRDVWEGDERTPIPDPGQLQA